mmetsp:Transcript_57378/g.134548  ORF Transcript_57378/g.134548 Transcript_57378/m.134548 type:complete len:825 (+) Transcript_57378:48-2522(+)
MASLRRVRNLSGQVVPELEPVRYGACSDEGCDASCRDSSIGACGSSNSPRQLRAHATLPTPVRRIRARATSGKGYDWRSVHADLEKGLYAGSYGWDNAAYWGISEAKAGIDLKEWYKTRTEAEFYLPEFKGLIDDPETQREWGNIVTFDPLGMTSHPPTIAACKAKLDIPELKDLNPDGEVVLDSREIVTSKCAVYYAWNLPALAPRLDLTEEELRQALFKYSNDSRLLDPNVRTYIPAVGGCTVYSFGDARKIRDPSTEVVVRVHDECIGSDVFGSDICSCRPYLIFALREAVMCAQRGGVGLVVYFRKEGRSLGEVIKFRVYNARTNQEGGDRPETYFHHTEAIAGIRDARFQTMMPDVLNWMGLKRIDWLCSMSNEKYEAITGAGIQVINRVDLPEDYVKESMKVELAAKIASGYHYNESDTPGSSQLYQLKTIRTKCEKLYALGTQGKLHFFTIDQSKIPDAVGAVEESIRANYPSLKVPAHSRLRHFEKEQLNSLVAGWECDKFEKARRLIDLVTVSVLLDAGAGPNWKYSAHGKQPIGSSEGLAAASLELFMAGFFSSDPALCTRVNSLALKKLTREALSAGLQVSASNPLHGLPGRVQILQDLGRALDAFPEFFGKEVPRPGNMVDFLMTRVEGQSLKLEHLWRACIEGLMPVWPMQSSGMRGDVWSHSLLRVTAQTGSDLIPFHKLTQWLVYSLADALEVSAGWKVTGMEELTCLPEYRNGGLLIDAGVLKLKDAGWLSKEVSVDSELVIEMRALTVVLVDQLAEQLRKKMKLSSAELPLASVLEGGTWNAGRQLAKKLRHDGSAPIRLRLDGTVF